MFLFDAKRQSGQRHEGRMAEFVAAKKGLVASYSAALWPRNLPQMPALQWFAILTAGRPTLNNLPKNAMQGVCGKKLGN